MHLHTIKASAHALKCKARFYKKTRPCVSNSLQVDACAAAKIKNGFQTVALLAFEWTGFDPGFR